MPCRRPPTQVIVPNTDISETDLHPLIVEFTQRSGHLREIDNFTHINIDIALIVAVLLSD